MQLSHSALAQHLQKQLLPLYVVSGDEPLLVDETLSELRTHAEQQGFAEREILEPGINFSWDTLKDHANSYSLFSDRVILEIRLKDNKFPDIAKKALQAYADNPPPTKLLLIRCSKLESQQTKAAWWQRLSEKGGMVPVWPLTREELPRFIQQRLQKLQMTADADSIRLLSEYGEGNLLALVQEIAKLNLLFAGEQLTVAKVSAAIADNARFNAFQLVDAMVLGETARALRILQALQKEDTEAILILWAIARELRTLAQMAFALEKGSALESLFYKFGVWEKRKMVVKKGLPRFSAQEWRGFLGQAFAIDCLIKGARSGDVWAELGRLVVGVGK